jgi:hypothetical protein
VGRLDIGVFLDTLPLVGRRDGNVLIPRVVLIQEACVATHEGFVVGLALDAVRSVVYPHHTLRINQTPNRVVLMQDLTLRVVRAPCVRDPVMVVSALNYNDYNIYICLCPLSMIVLSCPLLVAA